LHVTLYISDGDLDSLVDVSDRQYTLTNTTSRLLLVIFLHSHCWYAYSGDPLSILALPQTPHLRTHLCSGTLEHRRSTFPIRTPPDIRN
jgi:hypothetical protein